MHLLRPIGEVFQVIWEIASSYGGQLGGIASMIAILIAFVGLVRLCRPTFLWVRATVWNPIVEARTRTPRRTFLVRHGDRRMTFFHDTRQGSEELRQVSIGLHVSNVASRSVQVSKAWLHYRAWIVISKKQEGDIQIYNPSPEGGLGYDPIVPADQMRPATGSWIISPDREKERMRVRVRLIDQFGNECWSERITLFPMTDPRRMR